MSEDAGASTATGSAGQEGQQDQSQQPAQGASTGSSAGGTTAATSGDGGDLDGAELLAQMAGTGDGAEGAQDDPAAQLAKLQKQNADLKRHSRTWETRAKQNADAAEELAKIKDADKTEIQRATDRAVQAEKRAADAESLYHRTLAAAVHDIPPSLIDQIQGGTEDEINASAEALAAAINERAAVLAAAQAKANGGQQQNGGGLRGPVESLRPGALPSSDNKTAGPNDWLRAVLSQKK